MGAVSENHGHAAVIAGAQIAAGNTLQLDIRGTADHAHMVTLSSPALQSISAGSPVAVDSTTTASGSTSAHMHTVTFNANAPGEPIEY